MRLWVEISFRSFPDPAGRPSASLWGCELKCINLSVESTVQVVSLLVRLWVEIIRSPCQFVPLFVSLLVRLWVEISISYSSLLLCAVSLLVRLWVEIPLSIRKTSVSSSASLWGCELKYTRSCPDRFLIGQPPCEAVSWNSLWSGYCYCADRSASLWGCELKSCYYLIEAAKEMVSLLVRLWVEILLHFFQDLPGHCQPTCEAVSWNLSFSFVMYLAAVSLLVRLWVEIVVLISILLSRLRQPPCEAVSWNTSDPPL